MEDKYSYQRLFGKVIKNQIPAHVLRERNDAKSWKYGYNEEFDVVVVSKTGQVGEVYELQNLMIALPLAPPKIKTRGFSEDIENQYWKPHQIPKELLQIEYEAYDWNSRKENKGNFKTPTEMFFMKPISFQNKYLPVIDADFDRREHGEWIMICGKRTWIPPSHYFFIQHIPVHGSTLPDFRFTNRDFYLFWEACMADERCLGMDYLKNRRSGASSMSGSEDINIGTSTSEGFLGIMSKTNRDAESYLTKMVIRPFKKLPWYFKPQTSGTTSARSGLNFREVAKKITSANTTMMAEEGLDTTIQQFSTSLNSMDGEKVTKMTLDEFGKLPTEVPAEKYWSIAEECLVEGFKVVGKCMAISTVNSQDKGGKGYKAVYYASDVTKRMENGRTASGMYSFFIPAEWNQNGGYDKFGYSIVDDPITTVFNRDGDFVKKGNLTRLIEKGEALKAQSDVLYNEFLRKHPRTESHAFRDESGSSDMNLNKIYEQMDFNELIRPLPYDRYNVVNKGTESDPIIDLVQSKYGRFYISWIPPEHLRNNFYKKGDEFIPLNNFGCFGIDPYKVSKTVDGRGSKGSIHGLTGISMNVAEIPSNKFFVEYIERPKTIFTFLRDIRWILLYYGVPALIENNVDVAVKDLRANNMTHFSLRRRDKIKLSPDEKMYGGIPMTGDNIIQKHYFGLQNYVERFVGQDMEGKERDIAQMGDMSFNRTLDSWSKFSMTNRTTEDASISSGLCDIGLQFMGQSKKSNKTALEAVKFTMDEYDYSKSDSGI